MKKQVFLLISMALLVLVNFRAWAAVPTRTSYKKTFTVKQPRKANFATIGLAHKVGVVANSVGVLSSRVQDVGGDVLVEPQQIGRVLSEYTIQDIMGLLDFEIQNVELLRDHDYGWNLEDVIVQRNELLARSVPSVVAVYNKMIDMATSDVDLNRRITKNIQRPRVSLGSALSRKDRRLFLDIVLDSLRQYRKRLHGLQVKISTGQVTAGGIDFMIDVGGKITNFIDASGSMVNYCPLGKCK